MTNAFCVWLNGPLGTGKSTLAEMLGSSLKQMGLDIEILDENGLGACLGLDPALLSEEMGRHIRQFMHITGLLIRHNVVVIVTAERHRVNLNDISTDMDAVPMVDIFLNAPDDECRKRGASAMVRRSTIDWPSRPDAVVHTHPENPEESLDRLVSILAMLGFIRREAAGQGYTDDETEQIRKRLGELGYM
jgi:adenylylsulfate kinase